MKGRGRTVAAAATVTCLLLGGCLSTDAERPTSPTRSVPFFGLDVPKADLAEVGRVASVLGCHPSVVSVFVKLDTAFSVASLHALGTGGTTPFITFEPWPLALRSGQVSEPSYSLASLAAGKHDLALTRIAAVITAYGQPVYLRFAHEMNGNWYPWSARVNGGSPAEYIASWQHVHDVFARAGARNARWVWSPAALPGAATGSLGAPGALASLFPGDSYVDYVGFTGYGRGASARDTFAPWVAQVATFSSRPVVLSEIAASGPQKVDWISSLARYVAATPAIVGFVWFNTTPASTGATGYYRIDDSPDQVAAFRSVLHQLHVPCSSR